MKPIGDISAGATLALMSIRAKVSSGRIIVDQPTLLPEGTTLNLVVDDEGDDLDDEEREALSAHLAASWKSALAGNVRPASELLVTPSCTAACRVVAWPRNSRRTIC